MAAACDDDNGMDPSDEAVAFTANLLPTNEVPPVTGPDASGSGTVTMTLFVTTNGDDEITAARADFLVALNGFPANTTLTGAHVHEGDAGENGDIVIDTGITTGQITLPNGSVSFTRTNRPVDVEVAEDLLDDPDEFYFNVHTTLNPTGAVRGQMTRP